MRSDDASVNDNESIVSSEWWHCGQHWCWSIMGWCQGY